MLALTNSVPGPQTAYIDTYQFGNYSVSQPLAFTSAQGNGISVSHTTIGTNPLRVTLSVDSGSLTLVHPNPNGGIVYRTGDGYQDPTLVFEGTLADVNTALSWVGYTPPAEQYFQWTTASGGNGHWYRFISTAGTWSQANAAAAAASGYLATVTSAAETTFVNDLVYDTSLTYWLGGFQDRTSLTYTEPTGGWKWGQNGEAWSYTNWNAGEPNNFGGSEDFLAGNASAAGSWFDAAAGSTRGYVVEFNADPRPALRTQATLTLTTDDLAFAGPRLTDTDTVPINLARQAGFAESPNYSTNPAAVDTSFGTNGVVTVDASAGGIDSIIDMRVMPDGKIVAVGAVNNRVGLLRFNADGTLDPTFGPNGNGGVQVDLGNGVVPIEMQIDVAGRIMVLTPNSILRFTPDGVLDNSFGNGGKTSITQGAGASLRVTAENSYLIALVTTPWGLNETSRFLAYDTSGQLIQDVFDSQYFSGNTESEVLAADGIDGSIVVISDDVGGLIQSRVYRPQNTTYVSQQAYSVSVPNGWTSRSSMVLPDGRILLAGSSNNDFFVARLLRDGRLDTTFGANGVSRINILNNTDEGWRATLTADGKILVTGYGYNGVNNDVCVIRMSYDGVLDPSFGSAGRRWLNLGADDRSYAVAALPDGKILIGGQTGNDIALVRLLGDSINPNGPSDIGLSSASVLESAVVGTPVGVLTATDSTPGDTFTFSLVSGSGSTDNGLFTVSGNQLLVNGPLDFETKSVVSARVRVTDASGLWFEKVFSINVINTLEPPSAPVEQGSTKLSDARLNASEVSSTTTFRVGLGTSGAVVGATIELLLNGSPFATPKTRVLAPADVANGFVNFTVSAADLGADGAKSLTALARNVVGPSSPSGALAFTLDTVAPAAPAVPVEQGTTNLSDGRLNGVEAAAGTTIRVGLAGSGALAGDTVELFLGGAAFPTPKTVTLLPADIVNGFAVFSVYGADLGADGVKSLTAIVRDAAGNAGPQSGSLGFAMDTTPPAVPGAPIEQGSNKLADGLLNLVESSTSTTFRVGLGLSGATAGDTLELLLNGVPFATPQTFVLTSTEIASGYVDYTLTGIEIGADSPKSVTARVIDLAGNPGVESAPLAFVKDTAAATAPDSPVEQGTTKLADGWLNATEAAAATTIRVGLGTSGAIAGDRVELLLDANPFPTAKTLVLSDADIAAGAVDFSVSLADLGADGAKSITATVTDVYGTSSPTAALTFTLDTLAPATPGTPAEQGSTKLADTFLNAIESATATTFRVSLGSPGTAAGDTVELLLGGGSFTAPKRTVLTGADITNGYVDFSVIRADLGIDGGKIVSSRISDPAGNIAAAMGSLAFTLDTILPLAPLTPAERTTTKFADRFLNFAESSTPTTIRVGGLVATRAAVGDTLELLLNGAAFPTAKTVTISVAHLFDTYADFTVTTADLGADGSKAITARVITRGGNVGAESTSLWFVKDTVVPTPPAAPVEQGSTKLADGKLNRVESDSSTAVRVALGTSGAVAGDTLEILLNGASFAPPNRVVLSAADVTAGFVDFVVTNASLGADSTKAIAAQLTDMAGNVGLVSVDLVFIKDTIDPAAPTGTTEQGSTKFADGWLNIAEAATPTTVRIALAVGTIANDTLDLLLDGVPLKTVTINPLHILDGFVDFEITTADLGVDGAKTLSSRVVDQAGNIGLSAAPPVVFRKDLVAPTATAAVTEPFSTKFVDGILKVSEAGTLTVIRANFGALGAAVGDTLELLVNGRSFPTPKTRLLDALNISDRFVDFIVSTADLGADGAKAITARVTDAAGNPGVEGSALEFVKDANAPTAPDAPIEQGSAKLTDSWLSAAEAATETTFRVGVGTSGALEGDTIELLLGGVAFGAPKAVVLTGTDVTNGYVDFTVTGTDFGADGGKSLTARLIDRNATGPEGAALTFTKDTIAPDIAISSNLAALNGGATATITFTLSEPSIDFTLADVLATGGTLSAFSGSGATYTAIFTPASAYAGSGVVSVPAGVFSDAAGNPSTASNVLDLTIDTIPPTIALSSSTSTLKIGQSATITFTLSEPSTTFTASDVTVAGGTLSNFTGSGSVYTAEFIPGAGFTGTGTVDVAAGTFSDAMGNLNAAAAIQLPISIDTLAPAAPGAPVEQGSTKLADSRLSAAEAATATTFRVGLGASGALQGDTIELLLGGVAFGTPKAVVLTGTDVTNGYVDFTVAGADFGVDGAKSLTARLTDRNSTGPEGAALTFTKDTIAPDIAISSSLATLKAGATATITFSLSEPSSNFTLADITATGGTLSAFSGSGAVYTAIFTPAAAFAGNGTVAVAMGSFSDAAGNPSTASNVLNLSVDTIPPTIALSSSTSTLKIGQSATITFTLSEPSTTFTASDVMVAGGTLSNFTGSGSVYTAEFTPFAGFTGTGTVDVAVGTFADAVGNLNTVAAIRLPLTIDTLAPTVSISSSRSLVTLGQTATITFTLSEPSANFTAGDVIVTGGTISTFVGAGTNYTAVFTPAVNSPTLGTVAVSAGSFTDTAGNGNAAGALAVPITFQPTVMTVSSPTADGTYKAGDAILVAVKFTENITVIGSPLLALNVGGTRYATYLSGSGTDTLIFRYVVQPGDNTGDLDYSSSSALLLNGAVLSNTAGTSAAVVLAVPGAAGSLGFGKAIVVDTTAPTVTSVWATSPNGVYNAGQKVRIRVSLSEPVAVVGAPTLRLNSATNRVASYAGQMDAKTLNFLYTVQPGDTAADLDYTSTSALAGMIRDLVGNAANAMLAAPGTAGSLAANKNIVIDTAAPAVLAVDSLTASGSYKAGAVIRLRVRFSEPVNVVGTPLLAVNSAANRYAAYASVGSGTTSLLFNYVVQSGDNVASLDYASSTALVLNAGAIADAATNAAALALPVPGVSGSISASARVRIDTLSPAVRSLTSLVADGAYGIGQSVQFAVNMTEITYVTGTPLILLNTVPARYASFVSGGGTKTLVFSYAIEVGDASSRLSNASATALISNGAVIRDGAGNDAVLTLPAPGSVASLAGSSNIVIDGAIRATAAGFGATAATAPGFAQPATTIGLTFNTPVEGLTLNDIRLFYENRSIALTGAVVSGSGRSWTLTLPRTATSLKGGYRLDVGGPGSGTTAGGVQMTTVSSVYWRRV